MKYIMMTLDDAKGLAKKDAMVLVSIQDLENVELSVGFEKKTFGECDLIFSEASTIANIEDDFVNQLRVFTERQTDAINFIPKGRLSTILLKMK